MEQVVVLPVPEDTYLLSYTDDLALVVTGRRNKQRRTQQALDAISGKCEELGLKVSAEKSRAMMVKAANPAWQLQGVEPAWTKAYQYLGVWVDKRLSFTAYAVYMRTQVKLNVMRAMARLMAGTTYSVLRLYSQRSPSTSRGGLRCYKHAMRMRITLGAPRWTSTCVMQSETSLVPLTTSVQQIAACRVAWVTIRDGESAAQNLRLAMA